jgi:hypothetical protein
MTQSCNNVVTAPSRDQEKGLGRPNASPLAGIAACWDRFLSDIVTPAPDGDLPSEGQESASIGSPSKSYCMEELANGGVQIVNPPDCDDDRMEARV